MKRVTFLSLFVVLPLLLAACGVQATPAPTQIPPTPMLTEEPMEKPTEEPAPAADPLIVDIAVEDGRFTTLVTALEAAGLVDTLQGDGPFTVFAPTDDAFAALPEGTVEGLLADTEALTKVLLYHVVDGKLMAVQVIELDGQEVETLSGDNVMIVIEGENARINDSQVIIPDIEASNGVIHVIDAVLVP